MKDIVTWGGEKFEMEFFENTNFGDLEDVRQVYGIFLEGTGKICIVRPSEERGWRLPGGKIDKGESWKEAVIREADEEADIEVDEIVPIGYIKITPLDSSEGIYYALRVAGKITKINEQTEDVAEGLINDRKFILPEKFLDYCEWGEFGMNIIKKALEKLK